MSRKCFADADTCRNETNSCSGAGDCYSGVQAGKKGCFVCVCASNINGTGYAGDMCQKKDASSSFFLLAGTGMLERRADLDCDADMLVEKVCCYSG